MLTYLSILTRFNCHRVKAFYTGSDTSRHGIARHRTAPRGAVQKNCIPVDVTNAVTIRPNRHSESKEFSSVVAKPAKWADISAKLSPVCPANCNVYFFLLNCSIIHFTMANKI